jgi:hypothetical protein
MARMAANLRTTRSVGKKTVPRLNAPREAYDPGRRKSMWRVHRVPLDSEFNAAYKTNQLHNHMVL